jgi:hypothetical protein
MRQVLVEERLASSGRCQVPSKIVHCLFKAQARAPSRPWLGYLGLILSDLMLLIRPLCRIAMHLSLNQLLLPNTHRFLAPLCLPPNFMRRIFLQQDCAEQPDMCPNCQRLLIMSIHIYNYAKMSEV